MSGTLELLCGPRAAGKSSSCEKKEAHTYTTRPIRYSENDGIDRRFVDDRTFARLVDEGEIVVHYEFDEHRYGFSKDIIKVLSEGRNVSEQVGPYYAAKAVDEMFKPHGLVNKKLFLTFIHESSKSAAYRDFKHTPVRPIQKITEEYQDHFTEFDEVNFRLFDPKYAEKRIRAMKIMVGKEFMQFGLNYLSGIELYSTSFYISDENGRPVKKSSPIDMSDPKISKVLGETFLKITQHDLLIVSEDKRYAKRILMPERMFTEDERRVVEHLNSELFEKLDKNKEKLSSFDLDKLAFAFDKDSNINMNELSSLSIEYLLDIGGSKGYDEYKQRFDNPLFVPCHMAENYASIFQFRKAADIMKKCYGKSISPRIFNEWNNDLEGKLLSPKRRIMANLRTAKDLIVYKLLGPKYLDEDQIYLAKIGSKGGTKEFLKEIAGKTRDITDNIRLFFRDKWSYITHGMKKHSFEEYYHENIKPEMQKYPMIFKNIDLEDPEVIKEVFYIKTMQHYHTPYRERETRRVRKDMKKSLKIIDESEEFSKGLTKINKKLEELIKIMKESSEGDENDRNS